MKLLPENTDKFFRYKGSFTSPGLYINGDLNSNFANEYQIGCAERVTWTIFKEPLKISYDQMKKFWHLKTMKTEDETETKLNKNYRPDQPLNGREVIYADLKLDCKQKDWKESPECEIYHR